MLVFKLVTHDQHLLLAGYMTHMGKVGKQNENDGKLQLRRWGSDLWLIR